MENMDIYNRVRAVPEEAKKQITAGRLKGMTDINPIFRIKTLTEIFGPCGMGWTYEIDSQWTESYGEEIAAFCNIRLRVKIDGEWSRDIPGTGGSKFAAKEKSGVYVSDECFKMALTDALSVACKQLGIGADVYWAADRTKYGTPQEKEEPATVAQINTIKGLCDKHNINYPKLLAMKGVEEKTMTGPQAGMILAYIKKNIKDE